MVRDEKPYYGPHRDRLESLGLFPLLCFASTKNGWSSEATDKQYTVRRQLSHEGIRRDGCRIFLILPDDWDLKPGTVD